MSTVQDLEAFRYQEAVLKNPNHKAMLLSQHGNTTINHRNNTTVYHQSSSHPRPTQSLGMTQSVHSRWVFWVWCCRYLRFGLVYCCCFFQSLSEETISATQPSQLKINAYLKTILSSGAVPLSNSDTRDISGLGKPIDDGLQRTAIVMDEITMPNKYAWMLDNL